MDLKQFKEKVFEKAAQEGFKEYEIYFSKSNALSLEIYEKEVDKYSVNGSMGVSFRGIYNDKMGYSYTEILDADSVEMLVLKAKENALCIENEDLEVIFGEKQDYAILKSYNEELENIGTDKKIKFALDLEKDSFESNKKVVNIGDCVLEESIIEYGIMNSKGLDLYHRTNFIIGLVIPVIDENGTKYNGISFKISNNFSDFNAKAMAEEAVNDALSRIGGKSIKSGNYKVIIDNRTMALLLGTFSGAFSSDNAQKGLSLLKNKEGQFIASSKVTIVDDPHMNSGVYSTPFDAEGVATFKKNIVEEGKLNTLLYNIKTALKEGRKSTGNAFKASYSAPVMISPTNFYIQAGEKAMEELLKEVKEGLIITELAGTHAGANAVTGDFSLAAKGFLIKDGKKAEPVEQITIAGNFFKLLQDIEEVGNDLDFYFPMEAYFGSPSVIVSSLSVAGE
ncbi:TldD/PmbA family protein [Desnuesiella massiliensis]|uniref:TldD/PmbA family protein n=1 Tax=Desnuesiella massiliensis TaxID=1650662 RepID=UPI0006E2921A|nr:TldD/PmbA family protein [Desnuesiella massiliensis]